MALLDIVTSSGQPVILAFARGNSGTITDIVSNGTNEVAFPALGGSCTYPSEDDVRSGTVFGTVYTGNMTLPAEADVETGVQYGTSGTEFTGTFVGGGGGNVFIVNE